MDYNYKRLTDEALAESVESTDKVLLNKNGAIRQATVDQLTGDINKKLNEVNKKVDDVNSSLVNELQYPKIINISDNITLKVDKKSATLFIIDGNSSGTTEDNICVIPEEYRPTKRYLTPCYANDPPQVYPLRVFSNGSVGIMNQSANAFIQVQYIVGEISWLL